MACTRENTTPCPCVRGCRHSLACSHPSAVSHIVQWTCCNSNSTPPMAYNEDGAEHISSSARSARPLFDPAATKGNTGMRSSANAAYEVLGVRGAPQRRHSVSPRTTGREHVQGVRLLHHLRGFAFSLVPVTQQVRVQQQCLSDEAHMSHARRGICQEGRRRDVQTSCRGVGRAATPALPPACPALHGTGPPRSRPAATRTLAHVSADDGSRQHSHMHRAAPLPCTHLLCRVV